MEESVKFPSHIILNVNKNERDINTSAFCTNIKNENPGIRFTYLTDNDPLGPFSEDHKELFVITDSQRVIDLAGRAGIASAAVYTSQNRDRGFSGVLYCIEDIEYISYDRIVKMWQRFHRIPWTITETDRLVIREQTTDDIDALYEIYADDEAARYMEDLYEDKSREEEYLRDYIENQYRFYEYGIWALTEKESGKLIGRAGLSLREGYDIPEIGYIIGSDFRRLGYAKEAVNAILKYASDEMGLSEFMAFTKEKNIASVRLLKSLGFTRRGHARITGGDHAMYVLTLKR